MLKPTTHYTKSGRINIAYQVFGSGTIDLVYIPGWVSNIDWMWACPELVSFLEELGKICRVILFDKRGTGLSDRVVELSTLEERMDDIRAVMDAVDSRKAILFGHSEGGCVSALFTATYPSRVISLITFGIFAKRRYSPDYPWAPTDEERQSVYEMIEHNWGRGKMNLASLAPSKANDQVFMDWLANYFRSGASPSAALVLTKMNTQVDIIKILGSIKIPTLIMQRTHDIDVKIEEGRFIASRIHGAKFVELSGEDHLFWVGNTQEVIKEMSSFILEEKPQMDDELRLFTIITARASTSILGQRQLASDVVHQYRGSLAQYSNQTFIAVFEGPSKAVHCSIDLVDMFQNRKVDLSVAIQIKEYTIDEAQYVSSETEQLANDMLQLALPNQVLITQTVKFLLSGAGLSCDIHQTLIDPKSNDRLLLYTVSDQSRSEITNQIENGLSKRQHESFLESVLQSIDEHLSNESFGVEMLCREMGVSERQLQRKLKAITNKSPNQLITSVRLHRAKELLLNSDNNIAESAYQTGFSNPSYFSKRFKKEFGLTPSALLENALG